MGEHGALSGFWDSALWRGVPWWAWLGSWPLVLVVVGSGVGGLVVNCIVGASISAPRESLACGAMRLGVCGACFLFCFGLVLFVCFLCVACFYGRSVDALASGADEGRGGLR